MTQIAFVGKQHVTTLEAAYLDALGMGIALAGIELVTTPAGGAAIALAQGFEAAAGRPPRTTKLPITREDDAVLFYDDNRLYQALLGKDPSPIDERWVLLTSIKALEIYAEMVLAILADDGQEIAA